LRKAFLFIALVVCSSIGMLASKRTPDAQSVGAAKVIEIFAKKYEFNASEIRLKKGEKIELKVRSVDEPHGVKLSEFPEGSKDKSNPGLRFDEPNHNGKVEKNVDQVIDFVAVQAGTYEFKYAKLCGMGHGRMKGKLIVED
jgi:heme/copper-type cytochrome/quinol oxidase subunit 2